MGEAAGRNAAFGGNYISTTKYSPWTAAPQFLFEQLTRFSNAYFLFVGVLYCIDAISPVFTPGRYAILWVLTFVVAISGIKEAAEDVRRYRQDRGVNRAPTEVLGRAGAAAARTRWDAVRVGDLVKVREGEVFPADLVLLRSAADDGLAFVETKQLDGESNLKVKVVPPPLAGVFPSDAAALLVRARLDCDPPNDRLYRFHGALQLHGRAPPAVPLGPENLLIRGSSLRNTSHVLGVAVATGRDTKLMQNVKPRPPKASGLERMINRFLLVSLALLVAIVVALTIRSSQECRRQFIDGFAWYVLDRDECLPSQTALRFLTFFATFAGLLPISLYVSMEITRGFQVLFMERDAAMKDHDAGIKAEVRTSNLNEELGVVSYVFTDKTGTLTANKMDFKKCSLADRVYDWAPEPTHGAERLEDLRAAIAAGPGARGLTFTPRELDAGAIALRLLAICHSVVAEAPAAAAAAAAAGGDGDASAAASDESDGTAPSRVASSASLSAAAAAAAGGGIKYQASSPDEGALVIAAAANGYTFVSRSNQEVFILVNGKVEQYELLEVIEFDSTRKRMSVVVRCPDGRLRLFAKGADSVIFDRLAIDQDPTVTAQHLHDFAVEGLRTLCLGYRDLDEGFYRSWTQRYAEASSLIQGREEAVAAVADEVERDLVLLGATAIEDKLQDGVPETLRMLERAGVKVWVLTGDKQETAINVGLSCGAIEDGMDVYIINEDNAEDTAAQIDCAIGRWKALLHDERMTRKLCLVIDGQTLHFALRPELQSRLMHLSRMARSVIACRVSPKQKTELVELVRRHEGNKVTLAIGDGANDVGMIQAAHVGVGIVGVEGQEAKLASDYSIGQFRFLGRLMLVHGRWSYKRLSKMILFIVYKSMALTLCEMYWASFSAYSGQPLLDPWLPGIYNLICSSLPPILLGIFDQELTADYAMSFPEIYVKGQRNTACNLRVFSYWIFSALWHSALIFFISSWAIGGKALYNGQHLGMWAFGTVVFTLVVVTIHCFALLYQASWTVLTASLFAVSFLSWFLIGPLLSTTPVALTSDFSPPMNGVVHEVLSDPRVYMLMFLVPLLCVSPTLLWKFYKRQRRPNLKMLVQELIRSGRTREDVLSSVTEEPLVRLPSYDPDSGTPGAASAGSATFVKGSQQFAFSGYNFDGDDGVSLLIRRYAHASNKGVLRRRMRVLKRAGSDTELDVAGVHTADTPTSTDLCDAVNDSSALFAHRASRRRMRAPAGVDGGDGGGGDDRRGGESDGGGGGGGNEVGNDGDEIDGGAGGAAGAAAGAGGAAGAAEAGKSHRRAFSDGAVLVEKRYSRVANRDGADVGVVDSVADRGNT